MTDEDIGTSVEHCESHQRAGRKLAVGLVVVGLLAVGLCLCLGACGAGHWGSSRSLDVRFAPSRFKGDEDDDDFGRERANVPLDGDSDQDEDRRDNKGKGYVDGDDSLVRQFGPVADASDSRVIAALVRRYEQIAVTGDGTQGCALLTAVRAESLPEDYGPAYMRGARTCSEVLAAVFKRLHVVFAARFEVTGVRVDGDRAEALLGSYTLPAGTIHAAREHGTWKLGEVVPETLP